MITGKLYDWLKWLAQVVLPALGTLYFTLAGLWGLPSADSVVGTVLAVDLFLGVLLGISQANYGKQIADGGEVVIHPDGKHVFEVNSDLVDANNVGNKKEVRFKVKKASKTPK